MNSKLHFLFAAILFLVCSCVNPPSYPPKPKIEFLSVTPTTINQLDSVDVTVYFEDGDGDIGFEKFNPEQCDLCDTSCFNHPTFSVFLTDLRTGCLEPYNVPFIPAKGSSNAISGEIIIRVSSICCVPPSGFPCAVEPNYPNDTVYYKLQIRDRAGNLSNVVEVGPIFIGCI